MKIGIIIGTNEAEVVWNAFRFAITALKEGHKTNVFLLNSGVEAETITNEKFDIQEQIKQFRQHEGHIRACGTCLKSREKEGSAICPVSTMKDLLSMVAGSEKLLTFS